MLFLSKVVIFYYTFSAKKRARSKSPGKKGKKTPEAQVPKKDWSSLKKRGEEDNENKYIGKKVSLSYNFMIESWCLTSRSSNSHFIFYRFSKYLYRFVYFCVNFSS